MNRNLSYKDINSALEGINTEEKLSRYLEELKKSGCNETFSEFFLKVLVNKSMPKSDVISRSLIDRVYAYQILSGSRNAGRDKIITLCIAANFDIEDTQCALATAKTGILYPKNSRDSIILYAVMNKLNVIETNNLLLKFEESILE